LTDILTDENLRRALVLRLRRLYTHIFEKDKMGTSRTKIQADINRTEKALDKILDISENDMNRIKVARARVYYLTKKRRDAVGTPSKRLYTQKLFKAKMFLQSLMSKS